MPHNLPSDHSGDALVPIVDEARLNEFTLGNVDQLRELALLYITQTTEQLALLEGAIARGDVISTEQIAHKCAGSSATCGMMRIAPLLKEIEKRGREKNLERCGQLFQQVRGEYEAIENRLKEMMA